MRPSTFVAATLLIIGVAQATADQTNLVQNVSIHLSGVRQGPTVTNDNAVSMKVDVVRFDTRRVIQVIGAAMGSNFTATSKLVLVTPLNGDPFQFQIRDGDVQVDVTSYLVYEQLSGSVARLQSNLQTGKSSGIGYSIQRLRLQDGVVALADHFEVQGYAKQSSSSGQPGDIVKIDVSGTGDSEGLLILKGVVGIVGRQLEVVP